MRNNGHEGTGAFHYTTANGTAMNARAGALVLPEEPLREVVSSDLSVIAAQLIEAASKARDGDGEATREHIAHAVALLHGKLSFEPNVTRALPTTYLRTVAVHGLRLVFVDGGPRTFPMLENPYRDPKTGRSLSRREAVVLRMIARGMSNKCIARSLGIAPETVKTHVKAIFSKLGARTRAEAVARAQATGLP
jgi:DNA-binding NarL/FixJ family response regulator